MKLPRHISLVFLVLAAAGAVASAEITGKVREVSGNTAMVVIDGDASPTVGDSVEIFFKLAGANDEVLVASGKVAAVDAKVVYWRGSILHEKPDYAAAVADYEKAQELDPTKYLEKLIKTTKEVRDSQEKPAASPTRTKKKNKP